MTREEAIEIARYCAKAKPQSYYSEPFQPHEWVIDAIMMAQGKRGITEPATDIERLIDALRTEASIAATVDDARLLHAAADEIERLGSAEQRKGNAT